MARTVGVGIQEFEKIRANQQFYVDKTAFIGDWYRSNDAITLITRPRRFGKTLTIDMLYCFFALSYLGRADLFHGLAVSSDPEMMALQGSFPVIRISFSGLKAENFPAFLIGIAGRISRVLAHFRYLSDEGMLLAKEQDLFEEMSEAIPKVPDRNNEPGAYAEYIYKLTHIFQILSGWLRRCHGKKVLIFMDEYDTPVQTAYMHHYYEDAMSVMRELFSETFKENEHLDRAVITGITRIARESLFSEMNNLAICSLLSGGYETAFGFTQEETEAALIEYGIEDRKGLVKFWYDGFTIGGESGIYNPWSVLCYLSRRQYPPQAYWAQSGGLGLVDVLLKRGGYGLKEGFEVLLGCGAIEKPVREDLVFPRLETDENAVWSLLIAAGYVREETKSAGSAEKRGGAALSEEEQYALESPVRVKKRLVLTNYEARVSLGEMVMGWFETPSGNFMERFAEALLQNDISGMKEEMRQILLLSISSFDSGDKPSGSFVKPENYFHGLTLGMLTCLMGRYHVTSNRESGFGRYDVCLEPLSGAGRNAYILEFKIYDPKLDHTLKDTALRARRQIDIRAYDTELMGRGYAREAIRKFGFGFRGKEADIVSGYDDSH